MGNAEIDSLSSYRSYNFYNTKPVSDDGIRGRDVLDAMELVCEIARLDGTGAADCSKLEEPQASSVNNLQSLERHLGCIANSVLARTERSILTDVPRAVRASIGESAFRFQGERGAAAAELVAAIVSLRERNRTIGNQLVSFASDVRQLRGVLRTIDNSTEILKIKSAMFASDQWSKCAAGAGGVGPVGSIVVCANAAAQIAFAVTTEAIELENIEETRRAELESFNTRFRDHAEALRSAADQIEETAATMRASLARMETQKFNGWRALAKAMMMGTEEQGKQFAVNTVMRRRYNTLQKRYDEAREKAIRMAWLAKIAVEQRLGFRLADMNEEMLLVEAPATWADAVCSLSGIDYSRIRRENGLDLDEYSDGYVGDYVRRLEQVVQSYEHDYPFTDSQDTAIVSLREDIAHTRAPCETDSVNLLAYSTRLDFSSAWSQAGCLPIDAEGTICDCYWVKKLDAMDPADTPIPYTFGTTEMIPGYRVTFAPVQGVTTSFDPKAAVAQRVSLAPGVYRLSWHARLVEDPTDLIPMPRDYGANAVILRSESGEVVGVGRTKTCASREDEPGVDGSEDGEAVDAGAVDAAQDRGYSCIPADEVDPTRWYRYHFILQVPSSSDDTANYQVAIVPIVERTTPHSIDVAGLMLEQIDGLQLDDQAAVEAFDPAVSAPGLYVTTGAAGKAYSEQCEDTNGEVFRSKWERGCVRLCPNGYGSCPDADVHCFWEMSFNVSLEGIEQGRQLTHGGFAYGNYNYRLETVTVNFVGNGVRECDGTLSPSTCFSSGNMFYSLDHYGPFKVRNHEGNVYEAPLFNGRIEHGRGLAVERYITNPISSADRSLLEQYEHRELRGRPLTGDYLLRIWDDEGTSFRNLEDVQMVLKYRYWTRFN
ncbi:MAG: hypothetical protein V2A73_15770 [Pseudomonadota bacterium]